MSALKLHYFSEKTGKKTACGKLSYKCRTTTDYGIVTCVACRKGVNKEPNKQHTLFKQFLDNDKWAADTTSYGKKYVTFIVKSRKATGEYGDGNYIRQKIGNITLFEDGTGTLNLAMFPNEDYKIYLYEEE